MALLPVMVFAILGDTFNLREYEKIGYNVYYEHYNSRMSVDTRSTGSYQVIKSPTDVARFLGVEPRLSLDIKLTSKHKCWGLASFVKASPWLLSGGFVQILVKIRHIAGQEVPPVSPEINKRWEQKNPACIGTHYVYSYLVGGYLVASITFRTDREEQRELVERAVEKHLGRSGNLTDDFKDRLNKINEEIEDRMLHYKIDMLECVSCHWNPRSIEQIIGFNKGFPNDYANKAVPIIMELDDLSDLSRNYPSYFENREVLSVLKDLDKKLDDLKIAEFEFGQWEILMSSKIQMLTESEQDKINSFGKNISEVKEKLANAYYNLDYGKNSSVRQFDDFYDAYYASGNGDDDKLYMKRLKEFQESFSSSF